MSDEDLDGILNEVGDEILVALGQVARAAQTEISSANVAFTSSLANPSNPMVSQGMAERRLGAISAAARDGLRWLVQEPCVARVEVEWENSQDGPETYYFARRSVAGLGHALPSATLVTYNSNSGPALGRIAEYEVGESVTVNGREGHIVKRSFFHPTREGERWDALVRKFETMPWGDVLESIRYESLRLALEAIRRGDVEGLDEEDILGQLQEQAAAAELERQRIRRRVVDRIALRDQPILDKFQGEIFRLPLNHQVMLFGPPGSGKTTTLIKRLAQKRTPNALTEDEEVVVSAYVEDNLFKPNGWAMFSPTELLKEYLGMAFNLEGVPDAGNVRTWAKERYDLARHVLGILRSTNSGRFQMEANGSLLLDPSSRGTAALHDEFCEYADTLLLNRFNEAIDGLRKSEDQLVQSELSKFQRTIADGRKVGLIDVFRLLDQAEGLQSQMKRIGDQTADDLKAIVNKLLNTHRPLLEEIISALPTIKSQDGDEPEEDMDEPEEIASPAKNERLEAASLLMTAIRTWARAVAEGRKKIAGQSGRVLDLIGDRLPPEDDLVKVGKDIVTRSHLRTLVQAPRTLVLGIPALYARFRRQSMREGRHFAQNDATTTFVGHSRITPDEVDVVILVMLRNTRGVLQFSAARRLDNVTQHDWLEKIKSRYLMQVFVDEATDLSAVQLACTIELANPRLRSWFACGDLRQRITAGGLQSRAEVEWLNRATGVRVDIRDINIGYRQSQRLLDLADGLSAIDGDDLAGTEAPRGGEEADVWPLLGEGLSHEKLAEWLAGRIYEVEDSIGRLPSIAVFVDGDDLIDPLVTAVRPLLEKRNIKIVGCKEGRVVGDRSEVRVFDVQHIKGLEFEAVFFVGIDGLARRLPDLFQRFFYVGATRAATYLGVTCEGSLPVRLEPVRSHFNTVSWA